MKAWQFGTGTPGVDIRAALYAGNSPLLKRVDCYGSNHIDNGMVYCQRTETEWEVDASEVLEDFIDYCLESVPLSARIKDILGGVKEEDFLPVKAAIVLGRAANEDMANSTQRMQNLKDTLTDWICRAKAGTYRRYQ